MLGALTFSMSASSRGVRGVPSSRASTLNWCGATVSVLSNRTRRLMRMQARRRSLARCARPAGLDTPGLVLVRTVMGSSLFCLA